MPESPAVFLRGIVARQSLSLVPGVYEFEGTGRFSLRPGGSASVDELRSWIARDLAKGKTMTNDVWLIAQTMHDGSPAFILEAHDLATGSANAFALGFKKPMFGKRAKPVGDVVDLGLVSPIAGT